ncbi:MAG TPA: OPT family oligopeptide transporter [Phycisphaerae bacterium]|nr:OPT family oligopeptide transporter [Phycisphaerae bacterium]HOB73247.1 OPT family oligopeptide transporter [Phycisphaerae bacterium]HOJ54881.1 OPT family oligopeptide transporter [Phycisphaerae bacterium]HOL26067.1 OPT family oligopeptide transporter [Phycisphaerae bacterium]HPP21521.1 OPT family oligopeptide transporter [Phycisphaerae bacterium]
MAIQQLSPEQVRSMTLEEKDEWWLKNVFRGDMPQLTIRAGLTGMIIGGLLSLTNLYVGAKTGWTLGVGITSVILAFAFYRVLSMMGLASEFTILENNAMQSIATAAGYMTAPMISSLAAYMMVTNSIIPPFTTWIWIVVIATLGVLFAFPLKRRFINDEQHPFPEGRAAGIVMDALHTSDARTGLLKAKLLVGSGVVSALVELFKHHAILERVKLGMLTIPEHLENWFYTLTGWQPRIRGISLQQLTVTLEPEHVLFGAGGLMGIRTGVSLLVGACINYLLFAPWAIEIKHILPNEAGNYGFREITQWALWPGVAVMTTASLVAFFAKPAMIVSAFAGLLGGKAQISDPMKRIELPMSVFAIGIPIVGGIAVYLAHRFFDVSYLMGIIAIPLVFVFTLIAVNSTALTSITPIGAMGKLTQLTYGVLAPGNIKTNLMTAGITGEVASNAANLLMDIKPGYMLGAKPRQQAVGHVLGIIAGACAAVPVFHLVFLKNGVDGLVTDTYPMPSATIWKAVAEILTQGIHNLPSTAVKLAIVFAVLGIVMEVFRMITRDRFPLSAVGLGLAFVIPWSQCFAMFLGAFVFWLAGRQWKQVGTWGHRVIVENQEPICAGIIAGGALTGIAAIIIEQFLLS